MTIREIPIEALFGDVVERSELAFDAGNAHWRDVQALASLPTATRITFRSGRWLLCNLNTGTLKAYERHKRTIESI